MSARTFRLWSWAIIALLIAATIGFPFLLKAAVDFIMQGRHIGGARGAVALVFGIYGKLALIGLLGLVSAFAVGWRAYTTGQGAWWGGIAFLTVFVAGGAIFAFGNFWAANFVVGALYRIGLLVVIMVSAPLLVLLFVFGADYEKCLKPGEKINIILWPGRFPVGKIFSLSAGIYSLSSAAYLAYHLLISISINIYLAIEKFIKTYIIIIFDIVAVLSWIVFIISGLMLGVALRICAANAVSSNA